MSKLIDQVERIQRICWDMNFKRMQSRKALMEEHFRLSLIWAEALYIPERWPFFDVAKQLGQGQLPDIEEIIPSGLHIRVSASLMWMLRFESIQPRPQPELSHPYEALLRFYERGGGFTIEHGWIDIGGATFPPLQVSRYRNAPQLKDLSDEACDQIDGIGSTAYEQKREIS